MNLQRNGCAAKFRWSMVPFSLWLSLSVGCSHGSKGPISTSLTGLTYETSRYRGNIFDFDEILSANGLIPIPDVGYAFHFTEGSDLSSSIGLTLGDTSFVLVAETATIPNDDQVRALRDSLEELRRLTIETAAAVVGLDAVLGSLGTSSVQPERNEYLKRQLGVLEEKISDLEKAYGEEHRRFRMLRNTAGLLIATWHTKASSGVGVDASHIGGGHAVSRESRRGVLVLGGIRASYMFFGTDFASLLMKHDDTHQELLNYSSLVTHSLQARSVEYVADLEDSFEAALDVTIDEALLQPARWASPGTSIRLRLLTSRYRHLLNSGSIGEVSWTRHAFDFDHGNPDDPREAREWLDKAQHDHLLSNPGWKTVVAQLASPGRFTSTLLKMYNREYGESYND